MVQVNPLGLQAGEGSIPVGIDSNAGHQRNPASRPRGRHRLVRSFAARMNREIPAQHSLARGRQPLGSNDEVGVGTPDDDHAGLLSWFHEVILGALSQAVRSALRWRAAWPGASRTAPPTVRTDSHQEPT